MKADPIAVSRSSGLGALGRWVVALLVIGICAIYFHSAHAGPWETLSGRGGYYGLEARGFAQGQLSLPLKAPAGLLGLSDPYDPVANARFRESRAPLHDLSLFKGRLYLYFGAVPTVTLFLPFLVVTGQSLLQWIGAWFFASVGFAAGVWLLLHVRSQQPGSVGLFSTALAIAGFGASSGLVVLLSRADVYEVAIASGFCFTFLGWLAWVKATRPDAPSAGWAAACGTALALAVGSRPSLVVPVAISLIWMLKSHEMRRPRLAIAFFSPALLVALVLGAFNLLRFGSVFEWGQNFQLSNLREGAVTHFDPRFLLTNLKLYLFSGQQWTRHFPFLLGVQTVRVPAGHSGYEDPVSLLVLSPFLIAALAVPVLWRRGVGASSALVGQVATYCVASMLFVSCYFLAAQRYQVEFAPEWAWCAGVGVMLADTSVTPDRVRRGILRGVIVIFFLLTASTEYLMASLHDAKSRNDLARILLSIGDREQAMGVLKTVVQDAPDLAEPHVNLGNALIQSGDWRSAEEQYAAALWAQPRNFEARNNLADLLVQTGRLEDAVTQYQYSIELRPEEPVLHAHLAYALSRLGRPRDALAEWAQAARLEKQGIDAHLSYAVALVNLGNFSDAKTQFSIAAQRNPLSAAAHSGLGTSEAMLGNYEAAVSEFRTCLRIDPSDSIVRENLAEALRRLGKAGNGR